MEGSGSVRIMTDPDLQQFTNYCNPLPLVMCTAIVQMLCYMEINTGLAVTFPDSGTRYYLALLALPGLSSIFWRKLRFFDIRQHGQTYRCRSKLHGSSFNSVGFRYWQCFVFWIWCFTHDADHIQVLPSDQKLNFYSFLKFLSFLFEQENKVYFE